MAEWFIYSFIIQLDIYFFLGRQHALPSPLLCQRCTNIGGNARKIFPSTFRWQNTFSYIFHVFLPCQAPRRRNINSRFACSAYTGAHIATFWALPCGLNVADN